MVYNDKLQSSLVGSESQSGERSGGNGLQRIYIQINVDKDKGKRKESRIGKNKRKREERVGRGERRERADMDGKTS